MSEIRYLRARVLSAIESKGALYLPSADGTIKKLEGDSADLANAVLAFCAERARTRSEIVDHIRTLAGEIEDESVIDELLELLESTKALSPPAKAGGAGGGADARANTEAGQATTRTRTQTKRILLGLTGAVASAHAPLAVQLLQARGYEVRVMASESALRFVSRDALEAITGFPVISSIWEREVLRVPHIELAAWPDAVVLWPASATTISRIATGDCSELVSAVAITTRAPVLVAPSMNVAMYEAPSVRRNIDTLKADGFHVVPPAFAHEVADAPDQRRPAIGGAPGPSEIVALVDVVLRVAL
jgi:3-polyprenyl-4-hydroxybenzoate decarboxylase